jgi:transcriptional regulator with XRE-family HTH domain
MDTARAIQDARRAAGLTQAELAERSGTSQTAISAYEQGAKSPTPSTLARVLAAAGRRLTVSTASCPVRVPTTFELERRGRVLAQVIDLAERLPSATGRELRFPRLSTPRGARQ